MTLNAGTILLRLLSQPGGEFLQTGLDGCRGVIAEVSGGFCYISVGTLDIAGLRGQVFLDGLFSKCVFDFNNQIVDTYRS
ncbi:hypothetical protein ES703_22734 [subsurface metagenome]